MGRRERFALRFTGALIIFNELYTCIQSTHQQLREALNMAFPHFSPEPPADKVNRDDWLKVMQRASVIVDRLEVESPSS